MADTSPKELITRRHDEWVEHYARWRFLQDSLEGGDRYRYAVYGIDSIGYPAMNLIRHRREYPAESKDQNGLIAPFVYSPVTYMTAARAGLPPGMTNRVAATDNDYDLRLARTPVPAFVAEAITRHLSRIYAREVGRNGPAEITEWWNDVDGQGTTIDDWMSETIAPLLLTLGHLDLQFDRPEAPAGVAVRTRADEKSAGINRCIASYILPENMLWWRLTHAGRYAECLVLEYQEGDDGCLEPSYRHWTASESTLYDGEGNLIKRSPHFYGQVPIVRVFVRKKTRCRNVGHSDYEAIADRQREYYNRDSELILSDTLQAHPLLTGPDDYVREDGTVSVGPSYLLPKKKNSEGATPFYESWEFVDPPKGAAESIRRNKLDIRDGVDRDAALVKPAGSAGTGAGVVGQSGKSKAFDHAELNDLLTRRARTLARAERLAAEFALMVIRGGPIDAADKMSLVVTYPAEFDLYSAEDLAALIGELQKVLAAAGTLPETEGDLIKRLIRLAIPGLSDTRYAELDAEVVGFLTRAASKNQQ